MRALALAVAFVFLSSGVLADEKAEPKGKPADKAGHSRLHGHAHQHDHGDDDLPRAAPRGKEAAKPLPMPPFLGFFGPESLLQKTGFRGEVGSWIDFDLKSTSSGGASRGTMRVQQVGPPIRGGRWIELLVSGSGEGGIRMLTRGVKTGNVERMVASAPGIAPLEVPLESARFGDLAPGMTAENAADMGKLVHKGRKRIKIPLGEFLTDHWVVDTGENKLEFWITADPKVPFSGMVKMAFPDGVSEAIAVGADAVAKVPLPAKFN